MSTKSKVVASAPGRICFAGEDMDWMGGTSILSAVGLRTEVSVSQAVNLSKHIEIVSGHPVNASCIVSFDKLCDYSNRKLFLCQAAYKVMVDEGFPLAPISIKISSQIPQSAGLSSSAAVTIATLGAINGYFGNRLSLNKLMNLAYKVENIETSRNCGPMDFYSCGLGGTISVDASSSPPTITPFEDFETDVRVIIADTLCSRSTSKVIAKKEKRFASRDASIMKYKKEMASAVQGICKCAHNPLAIKDIGKIITHCHALLRDEMKVSTPTLNDCVSVSLELGALGAKLTGTGMGGCMFAVANSSNISAIVKKLKTIPVAIYITSFEKKGLVVNTNENCTV